MIRYTKQNIAFLSYNTWHCKRNDRQDIIFAVHRRWKKNFCCVNGKEKPKKPQHLN